MSVRNRPCVVSFVCASNMRSYDWSEGTELPLSVSSNVTLP